MNKEDYKDLSISELMILARKASTHQEKEFFINIANELRDKAAREEDQ